MRLFVISALAIATSGLPSFAAKSDASAPSGSVAKGTPATQPEKGLVARPNLTAAEVDEAVRRASRVKPKMSPAQVEAIVGNLSAGHGRATLDDTINALPRLPQIQVAATNGICRFDFVSDEKGRFSLTSWALLPGAQPSR